MHRLRCCGHRFQIADTSPLDLRKQIQGHGPCFPSQRVRPAASAAGACPKGTLTTERAFAAPACPQVQSEAGRRRSSVVGNSFGAVSSGTWAMVPGVWPWFSKRARRRASAS